MDILFEEIKNNPTGTDYYRFSRMAGEVVYYLEALPLDQEWTHVLLKGFNIKILNAQLCRNYPNLLYHHDHRDTSAFCETMWFYTKYPDGSRHSRDHEGSVFYAIEECRILPNMHEDSLKTITRVERLCNDFNKLLGRRCDDLSTEKVHILERQCQLYYSDMQETKKKLEQTKAEVDQLKRLLMHQEAINWRPDGHLRALLRQLSPQS